MEINKEFSNIVNEILKYEGNDKKQLALKQYIKLILVMARKYVRARSEYPDIIMEGVKGLMEAVDKFEPERSKEPDKEKAFKTYAITRMKGRMYEYAIANTRPVHIPTHVAKALSYVERMLKMLDKEPVLFNEGVSPKEVIAVFEHNKESCLPPKMSKMIKKMKQKVKNIAGNSMTNYETLVSRAMKGLTSEIKEEDLEGELHKNKNIQLCDDIDDMKNDCENILFIHERAEDLNRILGERKVFTLKMKIMGYNYKEISEALYKEGFTDHEISRQAVKGSIDSAKKKLRRFRILPKKEEK